jgi:hypothetical protein
LSTVDREGANGLVGLGVGRALAENDQWAFRALEHLEGTLDGRGRRDLCRRGIDHLDEGLAAGFGADHLSEQLRRQVEVDPARASGHRGADRSRDTDADVLGVQDAVGGLAQRLGDGELVHLLVVALLQVDDLALGRAGDEDHGEAVGGGVRECGQAVEEARRRYGEADARLLREVPGDGGGIAGVLFMPER